MTWAKASPVLALSVIFYLLQQMFELFIVFGPVLAAIGCTAVGNGAIGTDTGTVTGKVVAGGCGLAALAAGVFGAVGFEGFGLIMAEIIGIIGWGVVMFILLVVNRRIFKANAISLIEFFFCFIVSEIPLLEIIPGLPIFVFRLYKTEIKRDKAAMRAYEKERAEEEQRIRAQKLAFIQQAQVAQLAEAQVAAANEANYEETLSQEAANDSTYIPEEERRAA